ncbi:MAG: hypothetical protein Q8S33_05985 [Myxococcales bacterium]|nr:hypothetical protein [Myxococcales bacterium]
MPTEWIEALRKAPRAPSAPSAAARTQPAPPRRQSLQWEGISEALAAVLQSLSAKGEDIRHIAFTPGGGWLVLYGDQFQAFETPSTFLSALSSASQGARVNSAAFSANGWLFLMGKGGYRTEGTSKEFMEALVLASTADETLSSAALTHEGELFLRGTNGWWQRGVPEGLVDTLKRLNEEKATVDFVSMRSDRVWVMVHGGGRRWVYGSGVPPTLLEAMQRASERGSSITAIALAPAGGWVLIVK